MKKINIDELDKISGGKYSYETITAEELADLESIIKAMNTDPEKALGRLDDFYERMDKKYGRR